MTWAAKVSLRMGEFDLDVEIEGGERPVAIVGPNGAGKSMLLRILTGVIVPDAGEVVLGERVLFSSRDGVNVAVEERNIGYVPQGYGLFEHLTALDNVAFGLSTSMRRVSKGERRARALALLEELECASLHDRRPGELSGGERQRVALARALILDPALLALDEPLAALDASTRRAVRAFLADHVAARSTVLVTHDVRDLMRIECDIVVLEAGRVVQSGMLAELAAAPATAFVEELLNVAQL